MSFYFYIFMFHMFYPHVHELHFSHIFSFLLLSSTLSMFSVINLKWHFIIVSFGAVFSHAFPVFLPVLSAEATSYCCLCLIVVSCAPFCLLYSVLLVLFHLLPELCPLGFYLWLLLYNFPFKCLCLLLDTCLFLVFIDKQYLWFFWV